MQAGALNGLESFKKIALMNTLRGLINFPASILATYYFGLTGAVTGVVISGSAGWFLNRIALQSECRKLGLSYKSAKSSFDDISLLWKFSLPALLDGALAAPAVWVANTILAHQPNGYGELGFINATSQWRTLLFILPSIFCNAAMPILCSERNTCDGASNILDLTQKVTISIILPLFTATVFLGDFIMSLYGKSFAGGYPVLAWMAFSVCLLSITNVAATNLMAAGKMWISFIFNVIWGLVLICFVYLFSSGGATAYAIGNVIAYTVLLGLMYFYLRKDFSMRTILLILISASYLFMQTVLCLNLTAVIRLKLSALFIVISLFGSYLVIGRPYALKMLNKLEQFLRKPEKNA
jgi:O-antigen/teichoic acid export membrane protein